MFRTLDGIPSLVFAGLAFATLGAILAGWI
jgi:hypothetical protein